MSAMGRNRTFATAWHCILTGSMPCALQAATDSPYAGCYQSISTVFGATRLLFPSLTPPSYHTAILAGMTEDSFMKYFGTTLVAVSALALFPATSTVMAAEGVAARSGSTAPDARPSAPNTRPDARDPQPPARSGRFRMTYLNRTCTRPWTTCADGFNIQLAGFSWCCRRG